MITKKTLYSSLEKMCSALHHRVLTSEYKDYVIHLFALKILSPEGFKDLQNADSEVEDRLNELSQRTASDSYLPELKPLNTTKLGRASDKAGILRKLIDEISIVDCAQYLKHHDLIGDIYEYFLHTYSDVGKQIGQFYTPSEIGTLIGAILLNQVGSRPEVSIYDPTCGSGGLLLAIANQADNQRISVAGQDIDYSAYATAKLNMAIHQATKQIAQSDIRVGNTLANPQHIADGCLEQFDLVVSNPPYSCSNWMQEFDARQDPWNRFEYGIPPAKNGDYAFILHAIKAIKPNGFAAVVLPHGVLFRGNTEGAIRREIIKAGLIKAIISLPAKLFYGTDIPACVVILSKEPSSKIQFVNAANDFIKDGNKNKLRQRDIHKLVRAIANQETIPNYSYIVSYQDIEANDYNLNISRYVEPEAPEDHSDLGGLIYGGIPQSEIEGLNHYWGCCPDLKNQLFEEIRPGYFDVCQKPLNDFILEHPNIYALKTKTTELFQQWFNSHLAALESPSVATAPSLIKDLSETLLCVFNGVGLLDAYGLYQALYDYWDASMESDIFAIADGGWQASKTPDIIGSDLIMSKYFESDRIIVEQLEADLDTLKQDWDERLSECEPDDPIIECLGTNPKPTKANLTKLKQLDATLSEICDSLLKLQQRQKTLAKALNGEITRRRDQLTIDEAKALVIYEKWQKSLADIVEGEVDAIARSLASAIKKLDHDYSPDNSLLALEAECTKKTAAVRKAMAAMGFPIDG